MASVIYNSFKGKLDGSFDWTTSPIKIMLVTSAYVPNIDFDLFMSDITNEVVGDGYIAGGKSLLTPTIAIDTSADLARYSGANMTWDVSTITARGAVIYHDTGVDTTSPLIAYVDFLVDKSSQSGDFAIWWNNNGIFELA